MRLLTSLMYCFFLARMSFCEAVATDVLTVEQIKKGMEFERSKLMNGMFTAFGGMKQSDAGTPGSDFDGNVSWKMEFDFFSGNFLFDRSEPRRGTKDGRLRTFFCVNGPDAYYYTDYLDSCAWLRIRNKQDPVVEPGEFKHLDIRGVGFSSSTHLISRSQLGMKVFFDNYSVTNEGSKISIEAESDNVVRLWFDAVEGRIHFSLWVDKENGFTPIRNLSRQGTITTNDTRTDWRQISGAWVPVSLTGSMSTPYIPSQSESKEENIVWRNQEVNLAFDWSHVNAVDRDKPVFKYSELDFVRKTKVFDERVKPPKLVHIFGIKLPTNQSEIPKNTYGMIYTVLTVFFLSSMGIVFYLSRRSKKRHSE